MKTGAPSVYDPITQRPPCDLRASVQLTHNHDVNVGQQTAVAVGGVALVDSCVRRSSVMEHHGVIQHPLVVLWVIWQHTYTHKHTPVQKSFTGEQPHWDFPGPACSLIITGAGASELGYRQTGLMEEPRVLQPCLMTPWSLL